MNSAIFFVDYRNSMLLIKDFTMMDASNNFHTLITGGMLR